MEIEKRKWKFSALASLVCIGLRDHFLCKFQIVSNDNQIRFLNLDIQYLPYVLRNENWKCLLHERREIFLGLLLNSHPHGFYRIQTTRNKKMSSKKCQISILKRTLKSWFRVLIFHTHRSALSGSNVFCENFLWRVDEKMGSEQSCRSITLQKIRIGLNQRRKYVDKVIMALTMYDTFYNVN